MKQETSLDLHNLVMNQQRSSLNLCPSSTQIQNSSRVSEFHLRELSEDLDIQLIIFGLFLSMYLIAVLGNLLIVLAVSSDSHLHTPMYFFLSILSLNDICLTSTIVLKMIAGIQTHSNVISYAGCLTQMSLFVIFVCMEDLLLTVMAYDRYVAICQPLNYSVIMNPHLCGYLLLVSFSFSLLGSQLHNVFVIYFSYFKSLEIGDFFCDPSEVLSLSCSDILTKNIFMSFVGAIYGFLPFSGIFFSYCKILSSILRIPSAGKKYKAFSTCGSHLSVVCLFYGTGVGVYLSSEKSSSTNNGVAASVMYTVVIPMLNPFIYSLNNRDIKSALRRLHRRTV